jgi:hypothetical protein
VALLKSSGVTTLQPDDFTVANPQANCPAPILFTQYTNPGYYYNATRGNNVMGQVTATCDGVTSTFQCEISRKSKFINRPQGTEAYYCFDESTGYGYLLVTYNIDGTNNAGLYTPGTTYDISSDNAVKSLNDYVPYFRPTTQPTMSPTVPVGSGPLVPVYDSCNGLWIAVAHSRNGSQLCVLEEGKLARWTRTFSCAFKVSMCTF